MPQLPAPHRAYHIRLPHAKTREVVVKEEFVLLRRLPEWLDTLGVILAPKRANHQCLRLPPRKEHAAMRARQGIDHDIDRAHFIKRAPIGTLARNREPTSEPNMLSLL